MSSYSGFTPTTPTFLFMDDVIRGLMTTNSTSSTATYQYRVLATGVEGSTTDPDSIPADSVVIGII